MLTNLPETKLQRFSFTGCQVATRDGKRLHCTKPVSLLFLTGLIFRTLGPAAVTYQHYTHRHDRCETVTEPSVLRLYFPSSPCYIHLRCHPLAYIHWRCAQHAAAAAAAPSPCCLSGLTDWLCVCVCVCVQLRLTSRHAHPAPFCFYGLDSLPLTGQPKVTQ